MKALSVAQAASFLDVSDDTVRRWISAGRLTEHRDDAGRGVVDALDAVTPEDLLRADVRDES